MINSGTSVGILSSGAEALLGKPKHIGAKVIAVNILRWENDDFVIFFFDLALSGDYRELV